MPRRGRYALEDDLGRPISRWSGFGAGGEHRTREPVEDGLAALVGFDHDVRGADPLEFGRVAIVLPVVRAGDAERGDLVVPERLCAGLALDEDHVPEFSGLPKTGQPVQAQLRAFLPPELVVAVERDAEADRLLVAVRSTYGIRTAGVSTYL